MRSSATTTCWRCTRASTMAASLVVISWPPRWRPPPKPGTGCAIMSEDAQGLALLIRDLRKHRGLTLGELATQVKRSLGFLSQVERGLSQPTVADLTAISEALRVPTTYFYQASQPRELDWVTRPGERR